MTDALPLTGHVALVTGASRGVGRAVAVALAERGAAVACAARSTDTEPKRLPGTIDDTVRRILDRGGDALAVPADLSDIEQVEAMVHRTVAHFGRLDVVVNNAAIAFPGDIDTPPRRLALMWAVNVDAPLATMRAARPYLRDAGGGRIVNVSSFAALRYIPSMGPYGASKAALEHLTLMAAAQLREDAIAVNAFRIDTSVATEGYMMNVPDADHSRWAAPEVAAAGICWLIDQPLGHTGRLESMLELADSTDAMPSLRGRRRADAETS